MENKLQKIDEMGYNYSLTCIDGCHRICISRMEWWSNDTDMSSLPHWQGDSVQEVVDQAYSFCIA